MNRTRNASKRIHKKKEMRKKTKGFFGSKNRLNKTAKEQLMRSLRHSYIGRKLKKRDFRTIWITRINIACREKDINYSSFMRFLKMSQIKIDRKQISEMINLNPEIFDKLVEKSKNPWN